MLVFTLCLGGPAVNGQGLLTSMPWGWVPHLDCFHCSSSLNLTHAPKLGPWGSGESPGLGLEGLDPSTHLTPDLLCGLKPVSNLSGPQ